MGTLSAPVYELSPIPAPSAATGPPAAASDLPVRPPKRAREPSPGRRPSPPSLIPPSSPRASAALYQRRALRARIADADEKEVTLLVGLPIYLTRALFDAAARAGVREDDILRTALLSHLTPALADAYRLPREGFRGSFEPPPEILDLMIATRGHIPLAIWALLSADARAAVPREHWPPELEIANLHTVGGETTAGTARI